MAGRLVLRRRENEEVIIALPSGQTGKIRLTCAREGSARLAFELPEGWVVIRDELREKTREESVLAGTVFGAGGRNL